VRVHLVAPEGFDHPGQPTGGNIYDRRVGAGLAEAGWDVLVTTVAGAWPAPGPDARADLARIVSAIPDGETALIDGLIASPAAAQLLPHAGRIRMTVLLHMPLATALDAPNDADHDTSQERSERDVLRAAANVVVTSEWTRQLILSRYAIPADRVYVAQPGVDRVAAPPQPVRGHLICVGTLGRHKGQDLLIEALAELGDLDWHCVLAGPLDRDPDFVQQVRARISGLGYGHRVRLAGVLTGKPLSHAYTTADLLVAPSRSETYGMAVTEALAHGLPVIAAAVGGLPEALGANADGTRPGQLIPPGDPAALATALRGWLGDERHRDRLRAAARQRRSGLHGWDHTTRDLARALTATAGLEPPVPPSRLRLHAHERKGPMTFRTESRITVASSVSEVWDYMCDVGRWAEWAPTVLECWVRDGAPVQPGSHIEQRAKGPLWLTHRRSQQVTTVEPPHYLAFAGPMGTSAARWGMELKPLDDQQTDTMMWIEVDLAGIMRAVPSRMIKGSIQRVSDIEMVKIKAGAEAAARAKSSRSTP
jgi:glycosyltransferase involved in cell wall biosynthesis